MTAALLLTLGCLTVSPAQAESRKPRIAEERVVFRTIAGDISMVLYPDVAPAHVKQFLQLVKLGVYDGTHFHRLEPNFVAQISTAYERIPPLTPEQKAAVAPLKREFSELKHRRGVLSMAHSDDDPDSGETSFSILLGEAPHLDGKYTIFGEVEEGMDVVDNMFSVPRDGSRPLVRMTVMKAEVVPFRDLPTLRMAGPKYIPLPPGPPPMTRAERQEFFEQLFFFNSSILLILGLALLNFGLTKYVSHRVTTSLNLLVVLVGGFVFFVAMRPLCERSSLVAGAMFLALVGLFRLMGRFESTV